jgi:hypothetical protein
MLFDQFNNSGGGRDDNEDPYDKFDQMLENIANVGDLSAVPREKPMFSLGRIDYEPKGLLHMAICNGIVIMAMQNGHIIRLSLNATQELEDIEFARKKDDQIYKVFLDPNGNNLIISMENKENWYLHSSWQKPRALTKMKGIVIESVAWDMQNEDTSITGEILIGSRDGRIFETVIDSKDKFFETREKYFKPVYNLNEAMPITGLRYERFPPSKAEPKIFVLATTPTRIYQFIGGPTFEQMFILYERNPGFHELPGELTHSELCFFSKYRGVAKSFAWLTGPGIFHGNLVFGSQNPHDSVMTDTQLLPYPDAPVRAGSPPKVPVSITMTEFHFLLLYEDRFVAISKLNNANVYEESLGRAQPGSRMRGLVSDPTLGTIWAYAENGVYKLFINDEDRYVWRLYLEKGQYEEALSYCKDDWTKKDKVWCAQADHYFSQRGFELAAKYYGKTRKSFEEIALKFININERDALKAYLLAKLASLPDKDATQKTMICTWLTEIYLSKLNNLRDLRLDDQHEVLQDEIRQFLIDNKDHLDRGTTLHLLSSHGRVEEELFYASLIEDFERVVAQYVRDGAFDLALNVLANQNNVDLFYKFSPSLMRHVPQQTVNAWIAARTPLNPRRLIPALMRYDPSRNPPNDKQNQAIRYLEYCVKQGNEDVAIHNYLLSLYALLPDDDLLLNFLMNPKAHYDLKYALRLATKHKKEKACVLIYSCMGLYEEAVDLAMKVDIRLAQINANKPLDEELRKKLWLRIARHVVEEEKDIKKAMAFLSQSDLLKIEDILPFFPDFVLIDDFKEEICSSLEDYNRQIDELKREMDEATRSADLLRVDIKQLRSRYGFVAANQKCELCAYPVLSRQFYLFPCQHAYHADCLTREVVQHHSESQRKRIKELERRIAELSQTTNEGTSSRPEGKKEETLVVSQLDQLKAEFDELVAAECINCGDLIIDSIALPFDTADEATMRSWYI